MKNILVTGGSGMVGKSLKDILPEATYISSRDYDLTNEDKVISLLTNKQWDVVIHLAAKVGGIVDNILKPSDYFTENILMNTLMVKWSRLTKVKQFIGILSTCIYPDVMDIYPMKEEDLHAGAPTPTNFSYGYAKRCLAVDIDACNQQYGTKYSYLTPCNLYGEYDKYGENSHFVAALIKKIDNAKKNGDDKITLFGSGTPLRQFMYSGDLAQVIKECIDNEITDSFNVANEENYSIKTIAYMALRACNAEHLNLEFDATKPDGQFRKDVSIDKFRTFFPNFEFTELEAGIKKTYLYLKR